MEVFDATAMPSWADMVEDDNLTAVGKPMLKGPPGANLASELDLAANNSRDGINLCFKSVRRQRVQVSRLRLSVALHTPQSPLPRARGTFGAILFWCADP